MHLERLTSSPLAVIYVINTPSGQQKEGVFQTFQSYFDHFSNK